MEPRMIILLFAAIALLASCSNGEISDAYGQFETDEVTISAEVTGIIRLFEIDEGDLLEAGNRVGQIDSTQLHLKKEELYASLTSIRARIAPLDAQAEVYGEQMETARKDLQRFVNLGESNAATQQQIDQARGAVNVLEKQIRSIEAQKQSIYAEIETVKTRIQQIEDQLRKTEIINPIQGRVIRTYVEENELVVPGAPIYEIADMNEMTLRVYISGAQLPHVAIGQEVEVLIDKDANSLEKMSGHITWISSEAEFTPRMIQTKEERVTQVYALKVRVPNPEGRLKIGMPGEVRFKQF